MVTAERFKHGVVTISLDTEIGWGSVTNGEYSELAPRYDETKDAILKLLSLFDKYQTPVTWSLVGQLFREVPDGKRPEMGGVDPVPTEVAPPWERDWWDAPELINTIASSAVNHELAAHSGSHLVFSAANRSEVRADLSLFQELAAEYEPITSFVFPQHGVDHLDILRQFGFEQFRGRPPMLGTEPSPTAFLPRRRSGMVDIPGSVALRHFNGRNPLLRNLPNSIKLLGLKSGVKYAVRTGRVFHLVLHPSDFTLSDGEALLSTLDSFLASVAELRAAGEVQTMTMEAVADSATFPDE